MVQSCLPIDMVTCRIGRMRPLEIINELMQRTIP